MTHKTKIFILISLILYGCKENQLIESKIIFSSTEYKVQYNIFQTGWDNYRADIEYINLNSSEIIKLHSGYLNDARYKANKFIIDSKKVDQTLFIDTSYFYFEQISLETEELKIDIR